MPAPILKFKRGNLADLPGLQAGEPGFTVDKFDLFIGFNSTTGGNKVVGSSRYWTRETTTAGSGVNLVEGTNNGANHITLKAPDSIGSNQEYTFPASPTSGGFLRSDGSGTLTWDTGSGFNAGSFPLTALDIDGGTATSSLADADLFIVDDGANGTNRKVTFSTLSEAVLGGSGGANFSAINVTGIGTIGSNLIVGGTITAPNIRKSDGGLISLVGVSSASAHTGLVTAFKFRGSGLEDYIVADGVADIVLTGVAATTTTTSQTFTATQGQTTFTFSAGYSDGFLDVYLNGVRLITGTDYAATNGSTFVLTNGATAGDEIEAVAFKGLGQVTNLQSLKIVDNLTVTGVMTATGGVVGNLTGNITGSLANATANTLPLAVIDIDGGTDIGGTIADADLFIVDDGAGGTNRKTAASRIKDYVLGGGQGANFSAINVSGITTGTFLKSTTAVVGAGLTVTGALDVDGGANIASGLTVTGGLTANSAAVSDLTDGRVVLAGSSGELEDSGNLTFNGSALTVTGTASVTSNLTIGGNLTVNGTTSQINTTNTTIEDVLLELQKVDGGNLSSDTNKDVGLIMNYYSGSAKKAAFYWDDSAAKFVVSAVATESSGVLTNSTAGTLELGALFVNDCAGNSQVISCSGTTRSLENITVDGGAF